jgi:hypothetical protein
MSAKSMDNAHLIGQAPTNTPAALKSSAWKLRAMPDDLLEQASGRLGILALLAAALWVLATILDHVALHSSPGRTRWSRSRSSSTRAEKIGIPASSSTSASASAT